MTTLAGAAGWAGLAWSVSQTRLRAPDFIGVSFCALHHDQSHWRQACDRGRPGIFNIDGEPNRSLVATVRSANRQILGSVHEPLDDTSIAELHRSYNETKAAYRRVMEQRIAFLKKDTDT